MGAKTRSSKKMGRPPVANPREHLLVMRLTEQERNLISRAAAAADKLPGQWARDVAVERAKLADGEAP